MQGCLEPLGAAESNRKVLSSVLRYSNSSSTVFKTHQFTKGKPFGDPRQWVVHHACACEGSLYRVELVNEPVTDVSIDRQEFVLIDLRTTCIMASISEEKMPLEHQNIHSQGKLSEYTVLNTFYEMYSIASYRPSCTGISS